MFGEDKAPSLEQMSGSKTSSTSSAFEVLHEQVALLCF